MLLTSTDEYEGLSAYVAVVEDDDEPPRFRAAVFPGEMPEHLAGAAATPAPTSPAPTDEGSRRRP